MKILHYALGFPPYRSGGLTKFCIDLMSQQTKEGHCVAMLWPGDICFVNKKIRIKKHPDVDLQGRNVKSFEVINPLPVPYDEGIADINAFMVDGEKKVYEEFLNRYHPDVIHVHTLMGLHKNFLQAAKERHIRLVFTAHDFFPVCPKVTMFKNGAVCKNVITCTDCGLCNLTALSLRKIQILQSPLYRMMKDMSIVRKLRKRHRDEYLSETRIDGLRSSTKTAEDYKQLRGYYASLLQLMDMIHYNSSVTHSVYTSIFDLPSSCDISITHSNIRDNKVLKKYSENIIRIRYLGPNGSAKGFYLLKDALDDLWEVQQNFCLDVHFTPLETAPYIRVHDRYNYNDLKKIFDETDVLVAPSILYETFGFTVLEALSFGVPVILSDNVGAKDILAKDVGIVIENISADKLFNVIQMLTKSDLMRMNKNIVENQKIMQIEEMSEEIEKMCYNCKIT